LQNYSINNFIPSVIHQYFCPKAAIAGLKVGAFGCQFWKLLGIFIGKTNSPDNCHNIAKLFYK
jgi:hypothetical protein